jgi:hypothetical protein
MPPCESGHRHFESPPGRPGGPGFDSEFSTCLAAGDLGLAWPRAGLASACWDRASDLSDRPDRAQWQRSDLPGGLSQAGPAVAHWPPDPEPGSLARPESQAGSSVSGPPRGQAASASGASLSSVTVPASCGGRPRPGRAGATCTTAARTFDPTRRGGGGASALADGPSVPAALKSRRWQPESIEHSVGPSCQWPRRTPASMAKLTHSTPGWPWHRPVCGTQFALGESQSALTEKCPHAN